MSEEKTSGAEMRHFTAKQRLLILDVWLRSELSAGEIAPLVGVSKHTLYVWKKRFDASGPAGLEDQPRKKKARSSRLPEATQRAVLMLKRSHPDWGVDRIRDTLHRSEGYQASSGAIQRVLMNAGYEVELDATRPHDVSGPRRFERAKPNQLWQSDLFTFALKRENRRIYLVVFLDDHSRFVTGFAVHSTATGNVVREALESGIVAYGPPEEVLTDNGPQYHSWRGKSAFTKHLEKRGIRHIVARPRRPQTVGKTERFWKTLWTECLESAVCRDIADARTRVGHFIDHYNFQRTHQGIDGLIPADRFFNAEAEVRKAMEARVAQNALDLARHGEPRRPFYLTGKVGGEGISLHGEDGRVILTKEGGERSEVDLRVLGKRADSDEEEAGDAGAEE